MQMHTIELEYSAASNSINTHGPLNLYFFRVGDVALVVRALVSVARCSVGMENMGSNPTQGDPNWIV